MTRTIARRPAGPATATGILAIVAALVMASGAALWAASGTDLDAALTQGSIETYLAGALDNRSLVVANLSLWMLGVCLLGAAGIGFFRRTVARPLAGYLAVGSYVAGASLALAAFSLWLGLVLEVAPAHAAGADAAVLAAALGQAATIADWVATVLIVSVGSGLMAIAGRGDWVPGWLYAWGLLLLVLGVLSIIGLFIGARGSLTFLIVPVGLGWLLAAGIVALRPPASGAPRS